MQNNRIRFKKIACGRCYHRGFDQVKAIDDMPLFICQRCGNQWTSGLNGQPYARYANVDHSRFCTYTRKILAQIWYKQFVTKWLL